MVIGKMIAQGDFKMHSMQMYALKQTMLSQEMVFRKQVLELHRLYRIQKTMMQSIGYYDYGGHDLRIAREMSNIFPRTDPSRDDTLTTERNFFSISGVSLEQSINMRPRRPFDLRLSADQCISSVGEDLSGSDEHFNLPFEVLDKKRRKEDEMGILLGKKSCFLSENLINFEESIEGAAETATPPDRTTLENIYRDEHISLGFSDFGQINSSIMKNSVTKEESKSFDAGLLDLNEAYRDDSSCNSNDPIVTQNHSPEISPHFSGGISVNPTNIRALRSRSGNLEYSDDQTKEQRNETVDLSFEHKSGNFGDNNCMGQKNDAESVVEKDEDGPAIMKNTPIMSLSACDPFSGPEIGSQVSKTSISAEQEWISSHQIESKDKIIDKEVSAEVDPSIKNAAILLINMVSHDTNYDQPQCSSDSFEMIALKLRENSADEYSVSSKPIEMNNGDKRDYSFRLRRGRRLKDFQKEILPGLATLSRHEICEDINILEAVLRSREYKKVRANTEDRNKWRPPVRGKRSSVRRRLLL